MLSKLFKTSERVKIFETVLKRDSVTVTEISQDTNLSKGLVSRYLNIMKDSGFLERKNQKYIVKKQPKTRAIKLLLNLENLKWEEIRPEWGLSAGLYGSWASGTNKEESDLDIWIKVGKYPSEEDLNLLHKNLKKNTSSEVNLLILTATKIEKMKKTDPPFYHSLQRNSLILEGEPI